MTKILRFPALLLIAVGLSINTTSCMKATTATVPGALNNADAQLYQDMHTAQAAIEQAKKDIARFPQFKDVLNKIIAAYNAAESGYQAYHVAKGGDLVALQAQVAMLMTDIGKLQQAMGVKK